MSKLIHVYGDSYAAPTEKICTEEDAAKNDFKVSNIHTPWQWFNIVGRSLGCVAGKIHGMFGASNTYTIDTMLKTWDTINPGDIVIIVTTQITRRWLIYDRPDLSNVHYSNTPPHEWADISKQTSNAVIEYMRWLHNPNLDTIDGNVADLAFEGITNRLHEKEVTVLLIPGFEDSSTLYRGSAIGGLDQISNNEFESYYEGKLWYEKSRIPDQRVNHMCKTNHAILADKVIDTLVNNVPLDLTTGFKEKFLRYKDLDSLRGSELLEWGIR